MAEPAASPDHLFPTLTPVQIRRLAEHGRQRPIARDEVLLEVGDTVVPFFVVISGELEALRPAGGDNTAIATVGPGQFSGEVNMITGRRALVRIRVSVSGEVIELDRQAVVRVVQTDAELSEILLRAFILRRVELIARDAGDVV